MVRPTLLIASALALTALLPQPTAWVLALGAIILLGVPHGALDGEVARPMLRPRFGILWFLVFSLPYLLLFALVLVAWDRAPVPTLVVFLVASVWHFGSEEAADAEMLHIVACGGLPIGLPLLLHPAATLHILNIVAGVTLAAQGIKLAACIWAVAALAWVIRSLRDGRAVDVLPSLPIAAAFVVLPPLTAIGIYFVCRHAPLHVAALIRSGHAPRVRDTGSANLRSVPLTALTLGIGVGLWCLLPGLPGPVPDRLLCLTLRMLAALTLPHMVLTVLAETPRIAVRAS